MIPPRVTPSSAEASARMKTIRQRDTGPEIAVRKLLGDMGVRYRICRTNLPGRPDISNATQGWCIFVHGCFWHGHEGCRLATVPSANRAWWQKKIADNRARDRRKEAALRQLGFRVVTVWQCETRDLMAIGRRLERLVARGRSVKRT
jgi:DNA mismatch endonuclease, patch repair protein